MADTNVELYALLRDFNSIGGMGQTGQSGFCLLMALWQKSNELKWIRQFTMTNAELQFKAGFNSEKHLWDTRNRLRQQGYFDYIKPTNRKLPGTYILNFDLISLLPHCLPPVNSENLSLRLVNSEARSEVNSEARSETNINKLIKPIEQKIILQKTDTHVRDPDDEPFQFAQGIVLTSRELHDLTSNFHGSYMSFVHLYTDLSRKKQEGYVPPGSDYEELLKMISENRQVKGASV